MSTLLTYEFKSRKVYLYILIFTILLSSVADILIKANGGTLSLASMISLIVPLGYIAVESTIFYNELTVERQQLIYQTPNSMFKILGAKLIRISLTILALSLLLNLVHILIGYVPFMNMGVGTDSAVYLQGHEASILRIFSVLWSSTIVLAFISGSQFISIVYSAFIKRCRFRSLYMAVIYILVFYLFTGLMKLFLTELPLKIIMEGNTHLYFGKIGQLNIHSSHSAMFTLDVADDIAGVFYWDAQRIILGIAPIICNIIFTIVLYPLNALIMKKKVFA